MEEAVPVGVGQNHEVGITGVVVPLEERGAQRNQTGYFPGLFVNVGDVQIKV
jgi:hypothetical protein